MSPILNIAVKAARRAGKTILRYYDRLERVTVEQKGPNDFVSEVDRLAEDDIVDIIRARYPGHAIVAEERGGELGALGADPRGIEWLIDPLDGTTNYLHGHPQFAVSIAARQDGRLQHAVIFDPLREEMYTASRGQGAQLNSRRIRVTTQDKLAHALLATGSRKRAGPADPWLRTFKALLAQAVDVRRSGSAALDLAYIACGRLDGYWQSGLAPWDMGAGSLLVREAGGLTADFAGAQQYLESGEIVAANPFIFNELLLVIAAHANANVNAKP